MISDKQMITMHGQTNGWKGFSKCIVSMFCNYIFRRFENPTSYNLQTKYASDKNNNLIEHNKLTIIISFFTLKED